MLRMEQVRSLNPEFFLTQNVYSRSSSGSDEMKHTGQLIRRGDVNGHNGVGGGAGRTESPDTDSAFCDNLSVLSSCSAASSSKTGQSIG